MQRRHLLIAAVSSPAEDDPTAGLPDYSNCGFEDGLAPPPDAPVRLALKPEAGDATARIQAALDALAARPRDERGAVLLERGEYSIAGALRIAASGIVLRGEGNNDGGTTLIAAGATRRTLIEIRGARPGTAGRSAVAIADREVPVGARTFRVANPGRFRAGQLVLVRRASNAAWIHEIGMDRIRARPGDPASTVQWKPFHLDFERVITAIDGDRITIDAPVLCAIEQRWGGGEVLAFDDDARITHCGVEHLRGVSAFDRAVTATLRGVRYSSDEAHADTLVDVVNANHCWVRHLAARCFSLSCVEIGRARHITVEDCDNREMVSLITGSRRYPFHIAAGQRVLVRRCFSESGRHDFVVGARVPGPNVFLDCEALNAFATSEPHHRWSVGGLYDNVRANIAIQDRQYYGTGHGWAGANYALWNCEGTVISQRPPTANNWVVGQVGIRAEGAFAPRPEADWRSFGKRVALRSLFEAQSGARTGRA